MGRRRRKRGPEFEKTAIFISDHDDACQECQAPIAKSELMGHDQEIGTRCLRCAGYEGLMFVPSGDPALTRRARRYSTRQAVILQRAPQFGRYLRMGILAEPEAVERAQQQCVRDSHTRERAKVWRQERVKASQERYLGRFAETVSLLYPGCPPHEAQAIAARACATIRGVTPTGRAKKVNEALCRRSIMEYVRHAHTPYEDLIAKGTPKEDAAPAVAEAVAEIVARWAVASA